MYCASCAAEMLDDARFCSVCGTPCAPRRMSIRYAGFWKRVAAVCIDLVVFYLPIVILGNLIGVVPTPRNRLEWGRMPTPPSGPELSQAQWAMMMHLAYFTAFVYFLLAPYYILMEQSPMQGTLGKRIMKIKVTDLNGGRIRLGRAVGRYLARHLSFMIWQIGFLMAGFTAKKQALHDMIASCLVLRRA